MVSRFASGAGVGGAVAVDAIASGGRKVAVAKVEAERRRATVAAMVVVAVVVARSAMAAARLMRVSEPLADRRRTPYA